MINFEKCQNTVDFRSNVCYNIKHNEGVASGIAAASQHHDRKVRFCFNLRDSYIALRLYMGLFLYFPV